MMHRNLLLPCDSLPVEDPEPKADHKKATNVRTKQQRRADLNSESEDSEDEDEHEMVLRFSYHSQQGRTTSSLHPNAEPYQPRRAEEDNEQVIGIHLPADDEEGAVSEEAPEWQEPPEQVAEVEEEHAEGEPQVGHRHPQRQRHPPQMLTYDALGQPKVTTRGMDIKQMDVKKPLPCVQMLWRPWSADCKTAYTYIHTLQHLYTCTHTLQHPFKGTHHSQPTTHLFTALHIHKTAIETVGNSLFW